MIGLFYPNWQKLVELTSRLSIMRGPKWNIYCLKFSKRQRCLFLFSKYLPYHLCVDAANDFHTDSSIQQLPPAGDEWYPESSKRDDRQTQTLGCVCFIAFHCPCWQLLAALWHVFKCCSVISTFIWQRFLLHYNRESGRPLPFYNFLQRLTDPLWIDFVQNV